MRHSEQQNITKGFLVILLDGTWPYKHASLGGSREHRARIYPKRLHAEHNRCRRPCCYRINRSNERVICTPGVGTRAKIKYFGGDHSRIFEDPPWSRETITARILWLTCGSQPYRVLALLGMLIGINIEYTRAQIEARSVDTEENQVKRMEKIHL